MKLRPALIYILLLFSCVYDPPQKGKEISIHNQTGKAIIILDSLTGKQLQVYDTLMVNGRKYISRQPNYMTEYGVYQKFYADPAMKNLKSKGIYKSTIYIIDPNELPNDLKQISNHHSYRSFDINIDTLKKYELNHLFITNDTMFFEHGYNHYTNLKEDE